MLIFQKPKKCGNVAEAEIISNTIDAQLYRMQEGSPGNTLSPRNRRTYTHDLFWITHMVCALKDKTIHIL